MNFSSEYMSQLEVNLINYIFQKYNILKFWMDFA